MGERREKMVKSEKRRCEVKDGGTDRSFYNFRSDSSRGRGAFFAQRKKRVSTSVPRVHRSTPISFLYAITLE